MRRDLREDLPALTGSSPDLGSGGGTGPASDGDSGLASDGDSGPAGDPALRAARRRLWLDVAGITVSVIAFGLVFGLAAREAGFELVETIAFSVILFAGAAQFAAVGSVAAGLAWPGIIVLTLFINARHLLYAAALAPSLRTRPVLERVVAAHLLTDEAFALASTHFRRLGRTDMGGYWIAAIASTFIPWNLATIAGATLGAAIPDPYVVGLDIVFPAAMLGLAAGLVSGRASLVAAGAGGIIGVIATLVVGPEVGVVLGGLAGPLVAMALPGTDGVESGGGRA